jgi:hypothetical protein
VRLNFGVKEFSPFIVFLFAATLIGGKKRNPRLCFVCVARVNFFALDACHNSRRSIKVARELTLPFTYTYKESTYYGIASTRQPETNSADTNTNDKVIRQRHRQ